MVEDDGWMFGGCAPSPPSKPSSYKIKAKAWDEVRKYMKGTEIAQIMDDTFDLVKKELMDEYEVKMKEWIKE